MADTVVTFAKDAAKSVTDAVDGAMTGTADAINNTGNAITDAVDNNAITRNARTDAYTGHAIFGTLGAATDIASGGMLSRFGEYLGSAAYDLMNPATVPDPVPLTTVQAHTAYWKS